MIKKNPFKVQSILHTKGFFICPKADLLYSFTPVCSLFYKYLCVCSLYYITVQFYLLKAAQNRGIIHTEQKKRTNKNTKHKIRTIIERRTKQ